MDGESFAEMAVVSGDLGIGKGVVEAMTPLPNIQDRYAICCDHGRTVENIRVTCVKCGRTEKKRGEHRFSDTQLAGRLFPKWAVKGVNRKRKTLCPKCARQK